MRIDPFASWAMTFFGVVSARKDQRKDAISAAKGKSTEGKPRCFSLVLSVTASAGRPKLLRPTFWGSGVYIVRRGEGVIKVRSGGDLGERRTTGFWDLRREGKGMGLRKQ